ncbi:hypothetical protein [Saccharothrix obliqua]|uniref:hypothetical protein n=1 Tax=Saccharothrix obliqua TaxID=2861747 RepID=UPI001C5FC062|nr:hypothetical protein [Saccharothrix obliqua]MBW4716843.1 hypothetical protein [Saccharothrix obliqua]
MTFWKSRRDPEPFLDRGQARLAFLLHEYNAIRAELVAAVGTQQTVMNYGLAAIAVVFTGVLASWSNVPVRTGILSLTPVLLMSVWFVWYGEVKRLLRTRWFLWELEKKVNGLVGAADVPTGGSDLPTGDVLHWESWVRGRNRWRVNLHSRPAYHLATVLLCGTGLGGTALSVGLAFAGDLATPLRVLVVGGAVGFLALFTYAVRVVRANPMLADAGRTVN